jgi:hypothetical protein
MIDSLVWLRLRTDAPTFMPGLNLEPGAYVLVTLHPRLIDAPLLERALASLARLSRAMTLGLPLHPRTRARLASPQSESWPEAGRPHRLRGFPRSRASSHRDDHGLRG